jgi:CBS domain-containing protein
MNQLETPTPAPLLHFNRGYRETAALRGGQDVTLRLVRPTDKDLLRRGFERLSPESRYRRFFAAKTTLSDAELAYLTELDGLNHFAIAATVRLQDETEDGLGIARFVRSKIDPKVAEAAVTVVLLRLVAAARERGIERFESRALADNRALRDVLVPLGPAVRVRQEGEEIVMGVELPNVPSDALADADARDAPQHRLLPLAARGLPRTMHFARPARCLPMDDSVGRARRASMQCRDVMKTAKTVRGSVSAADCAKMMAVEEVGILPIVDQEQRLIGVVTDRDLAVRVLAEHRPPDTPVGKVMTTGVVTCRPLDGLRFAEQRLADAKVSRIVVMDEDNKVLGIISLSDIGQVEDPKRAGRVLRAITEREVSE